MKKLRHIVWFFVFFSQIAIAQDTKKFGYFLEGNRTSLRIPFELHSNLIIVPVFINKSDTLRFILDTGVSSIIITDPKALGNQKLNFVRKVQLTGAGEQTQALEGNVAIGNTLRMNKLTANYQNLVVINEDILHLSEFVGIPIHGIFGYDLFNHFVVTIDFRNKYLILQNPEKYKYRRRKGDQYPITIEDTKPYMNLVASVDNGNEIPIRALIDTGAGHALLLDPNAQNTIQLPEKVIRAQLGRGLNGVINGNIGRIEKIKLGKYEMQNVITSFPDSIAFGVKIKAIRQGNIGCELLRRFVVTFNYAEKYMILKPIRRNLKESFEHDMSGLELRAKGEKLKQYVIDKVITGSPAWASGLQEGDELLYVNNSKVETLSISEIYKILQHGEGREVTLLVRRKERIEFVRFQLKRMI